MKNFSIKVDNKEYWISRSIAVVGFVITKDEKGNFVFLANKRGKGCPDYQGCWNLPCGYLDYNETTKQAVSREIYEETGLNVPTYNFDLYNIDDSPGANRQNVTFVYWTKNPHYYLQQLTTKNSEKNEVADIKWVKFKDVHKFKWAFNHKQLIREMLEIIPYDK